ncbi:E3 ubiquitin-protein ligase rnf19a [Xenoophorus captivus]|uniref:E3 ubiquitin-protein ligase rnf19a n=1 Tax=Xenoophorus captivus TaxID=1517983 RepID=A0ABV0RKC0_9TELE
MGSDRDLQSTASSISLPSVKKAPKKRRLSLASLFRRRGRDTKSGCQRSRELQHPGSGGLAGVDGIASIESIHSEMCNDKNSAFLSVAGTGAALAAAASFSSASGPSSSTSSSSKIGVRVGAELLECPLCLLRLSRESFPDIMTCHHRSCIDCLRQYLRIEISESRVNISCPECSERFNPHDIRMILGDRMLMEKYEEFMLRRWLVADPDCRWCPAPDCGNCLRLCGCLGRNKIPSEFLEVPHVFWCFFLLPQ